MSALETGPGTIGAGLIRFYDSIKPPLTAGKYTLHAKQVVKDVVQNGNDPEYIAEQQLLVDGPRFSIDPISIHSMYPPANQEGTFNYALPNMVFNSFSLPWSRKVGKVTVITPPPDEDKQPIPWMGLLTIYGAEMTDATKVGKPFSVKVSEFLTAPANVLLPDISDIINQSEVLTGIDINLKYFQAIAPALAELPFLAHAREVNTGGKVMLGMNDDGCFSVVIGNRLPGAAMKNNILLVSYEGHQNHLAGSTIPGTYDTIRLVLLGSWQFTGNASVGSFKALMKDLCDEKRGAGVSLLQMDIAETTEKNELAQEALEISYIPLQNNMRVGETSTSWYRGPLVAEPTKRDFTYGPYLYSDHAIQYDPEYGMFNHAYAASWQIGRLLALSDASFASGFFKWRNKYLNSVISESKNINLKQKAKILGFADDDAERTIPGAMMSMFAQKFHKVDWPAFKTRDEHQAPGQLPGKLENEEIRQLLENGEDPVIELMKKIKGVKL